MRNAVAGLLALATVALGVVLFTSTSRQPTAPLAATPTTSAVAPATTTVSGTVLDEQGEPVAFAAVTVGDAFALTSEAGTFSVEAPGATSISVTANRYVPTTVPTTADRPADIRLAEAAPAALTAVVPDGLTAVTLYDSASLAEVARAIPDGARLIRIESVPAGDYLAVANGRSLDPVARPVRLPFASGATLRLDTPAHSTGLNAEARPSTVTVRDIAGLPVGTNGSREVWLTVEGAEGLRQFDVGSEGVTEIQASPQSTVRALVWDRNAATLSASAAREVAATMTLTPSSPAPLPFPAAGLPAARTAPDSCAKPSIVPVTGVSTATSMVDVLDRELQTTSTVDFGSGYALVASTFDAPRGRVLPALGLLDLRDGTPLARLLPADEFGEWQTSWADVEGFLQYTREIATRRDRPDAAKMKLYRDGGGFLHVDIGEIRNDLGAKVPDGTWVAIRLSDGRVLDPEGVAGAGVTLFRTAHGRVDDILLEPDRAGQAPGEVTDISVWSVCVTSKSTAGVELAHVRIVDPYPRTLSFVASLGTPRSSATCGPEDPFEAEIRIRFDEEGAEHPVTIPIAGGPTLRGTYDLASRVVQAQGEIDGTYWLIVASLSADAKHLDGELTVTVTGQECDRTDHFPLRGTLTAPGDAVPSAPPSSLDDPRVPRA